MYTEMLAVMKQHYCLKTAVVVQRIKFNSCAWQVGESMADYVA